MHDDDMPQSSFNDVEVAHVTFPELVLLAEAPPALSMQVALLLVCETTHLPRPGAGQGGLERDRAMFTEPDRVAEGRRQRLQEFKVNWFDSRYSSVSGR